jgi:membrane-bound lytic murein transglycosylase D
MPGELALLPMIESSFNPQAKSHMGATGIWQLGAITGRRFGLNKNSWYDERKDLVAATNAALSYLEYLHEEFDGDWFLALAAYNAGEGRIKRAIRRNLAHNKPTDFWSLQLPNETKNFVPKLLALANLVKYANLSEIAANFPIIRSNS